EILPSEIMCPAVGQGALAVETRADGAGFDAVQQLNDPATRAEVTAERAVLAALGGGCQVPIGAHAAVEEGRLRMVAVVASPDGRELVRAEAEGAAANGVAIGCGLGAELMRRGAKKILEGVHA